MSLATPKRALAAVAGAGLAVAGGVLGRRRFGRSSAPDAPAGPHQPGPANVDVAGPPENTATAVPVPEPGVGLEPVLVDEAHEEAAAAAEAAAIGGSVSDYAGTARDEPMDEAMRPVLEGGGGESEGFEQAEALLEEHASLPDRTPGAEDATKQLDDAIDAHDAPGRGESDEGRRSTGASGEADQVIHEDR